MILRDEHLVAIRNRAVESIPFRFLILSIAVSRCIVEKQSAVSNRDRNILRKLEKVGKRVLSFDERIDQDLTHLNPENDLALEVANFLRDAIHLTENRLKKLPRNSWATLKDTLQEVFANPMKALTICCIEDLENTTDITDSLRLPGEYFFPDLDIEENKLVTWIAENDAIHSRATKVSFDNPTLPDQEEIFRNAAAFQSDFLESLSLTNLLKYCQMVISAFKKLQGFHKHLLAIQGQPVLDCLDEVLKQSLVQDARKIQSAKEQLRVVGYGYGHILSTDQASELLNIGPDWVRVMAKEGRIGYSVSRFRVFSSFELSEFDKKERIVGKPKLSD